MKKKSGVGNFALITIAFLLFFLSLTVYHIYLRSAQSIKITSNDKAILSVLAANVADRYEYASCKVVALDTTGYTGYGDYNLPNDFREGCKGAYSLAQKRFEDALMKNFDATKAGGNTYESNLPYLGTIVVNEFKIYNIRYNDVYENSGGETTVYSNQVGIMTTPNGKTISHSGVYADMTLTIKGLGPFGDFTMPMKEYVDIKENN